MSSQQRYPVRVRVFAPTRASESSATAAATTTAAGAGALHGGFHGDPARNNEFWVYPPHRRLVTPRWDTHLHASQFCSNHVVVRHGSDSVTTYRCLGHSAEAAEAPRPQLRRSPGEGCLVNGYHGDPARGHSFWIYPQHRPLVTARWDTHLAGRAFCSKHRVLSRGADGVVTCICLGHLGEDEDEDARQGGDGFTGSGQLVKGFHGDPSRGNTFWQYPPFRRLVTPRWDTHVPAQDFCTNHRVKQRKPNGVVMFECLGHSTTTQSNSPQHSLPLTVEECVKKWTGPVDQRGTLRDYVPILDLMAVHPRVMAASAHGAAIEHMNKVMEKEPTLLTSFEKTAAGFVCASFELQSELEARRFSCRPLGDNSLPGGHVFSAFVGLHSQLGPWHRRYFHASLASILKAFHQQHEQDQTRGDSVSEQAALEGHEGSRNEKLKHADIDRFQLEYLARLIIRGHRECFARKMWVFYSVVQAYSQIYRAELQSLSLPSSDEAISPTSSSDMASSSSAQPRATTLEPSTFLHKSLFQFIDSYKDKIFHTVFMVPSEKALTLIRSSAAIDSDVHGANVFLALLVSTIGVQTNRLPFFNDDGKGYADFLSAGGDFCGKWLPFLWNKHGDNSNFSVPPPSVPCSIARRPEVNRIAGFPAASPFDLARWAVEPKTSENAPSSATGLAGAQNWDSQRAKLVPYVAAFAAHFSAKIIGPRLANLILQDENLSAAADSVVRTILASADSDALDKDSSSCSGAESTFAAFVWEEDDSEEYVFKTENAVLFFQHVGVFK